MVFYFFIRCYNVYGSDLVYSPIGDLLDLRLADYGEAIRTFAIEAHLRSATYNPLPTLEEMFEEHHRRLEKLPRITFLRKLRQVKIGFESKVRTAEDERVERGRYSVETTNAAMREFTTVLPLLGRRLEQSDDFDYPRFISDANRLLIQGFASEEEIRLVAAGVKEKRHSENPWELLEVDWRKFHPKARDILRQPILLELR